MKISTQEAMKRVFDSKSYTGGFVAKIVGGTLACFTVLLAPLGIAAITHAIYKTYKEVKRQKEQAQQDQKVKPKVKILVTSSEDFSGNQKSSCNFGQFLIAQKKHYDTAMAEINSGKKQTHWMWYLFPIMKWSSASNHSKNYCFDSIADVTAYWNHPILGQRLRNSFLAVERQLAAGNTLKNLFGDIDEDRYIRCKNLFLTYMAQDKNLEAHADLYRLDRSQCAAPLAD